MEIIGIDVGFGFTKAYNGRNSVIFKSVIGDATDIQFSASMGDASSTSNLHITLDGKSYFLGNYAEQQSSITEYTLDQSKLIEEFVKILAVTAAGLCAESNAPLQVVTGLPVSYLRRDSRKLRDMIKGTHQITYHNAGGDDVHRTIIIDKVKVIPQPIGSIFNLIFDEGGNIKDRDLATQKLGVVDVGFKTTDFSIFDRLQYIERGSSTMETGISKCYSVISSKLRQESNINIELYRMHKFIQSGSVKIRGKEYNISNLKKRVYAHSAAGIAADVNRLWEDDWDMDAIVLSGGGGLELTEYLAPAIEGEVLPMPQNTDVRFNNVQGYCKFGKYKWGRTPAKAAATPEQDDTKTDKNDSASPEASTETDQPAGKGLSWMRR